jgi:hypothetical protein
LKQKPPTPVAADLAPQATPIGASHTSQTGSTQHAQASSSMGASEGPPMPRSALSWAPPESAKPGHANGSFSSPPVDPRGAAQQRNELPDLLAGFDNNFTSNFKDGDAQVLPTTYAPPTTDGNWGMTCPLQTKLPTRRLRPPLHETYDNHIRLWQQLLRCPSRFAKSIPWPYSVQNHMLCSHKNRPLLQANTLRTFKLEMQGLQAQ